MSGWKTWASGIGSILSGIATILVTISSDNFDMSVVQGGLALIVTGGGIIGIGHKIEKS